MNAQEIHEIIRDNYRLTQLLSRFLSIAPDAITREMMESMKSTTIDSSEAYAHLLAALFEFDMDDYRHRRFFRTLLLPSVKKLDPSLYRRDPYFASIHFPSAVIGDWELKTITYPAYRGFICGDPVRHGLVECQQIGFFEEEFSFPAVLEHDNEWMTLTPVDMDTCQDAIRSARGKCITFGLGLGYYIFMVSNRPEVSSITVVERSADVIQLFETVLLPQFPNRNKVRIVQDDAFHYAEHTMPTERFDHAFVDTWRDAGDGLEHYLRMKPLETLNPTTAFEYWIEETILSRMRAFVFEDHIERVEQGRMTPSELETLLSRDSLRKIAKYRQFRLESHL